MRLSTFAALALSCVVSLAASAETINFNNQTGPNGSVFTSDTQGSFTATPGSGTFRIGQFFGNPAPGLYTLDNSATFDVTRNNGGDFNFTSVDLAVGAGTGSYTIAGFLDGVQEFSVMGDITGFGTFTTYDPGDSMDDIDSLQIMLMNTGGSTDLDNIVVAKASAAAVTPEPSSLLLLATGLVGAAVLGRRRLFA